MSCMGISCYEDGFRLAGPPSECSLRSKARIDALFEDSRSICSSALGGWYAGVSTVNTTNPDDVGTDEQKRINSAVQARIEAMFASVEAENGTPGECAAAILPVKYMGAAPVGGRVASVRGLQEPLRQLVERMGDSIRAELEVSRRGLTFRTSEICERNNPFRRIAVWSALRLRSKRDASSGDLHHAFLPLVGDQDQSQTAEDKHADLYRTMRGIRTELDEYPPIFAVVMRRPGAARVLECHAFACETEEDAVAAAATLYRALLADLDANRRRPRHANGVGCISLASVASSVREISPSSRISHRLNILPVPLSKPVISQHPVRPPRTKKTSISSSITEEEPSKPVDQQKIPRRKKKNSDANAEDILEARERRKDPSIKDKVNLSSSSTCELHLTKDEQWQNSRNDLHTMQSNYSNKVEQNSPAKIEPERPASRLEKLYDTSSKIGSEIYERQTNKYEKLPFKRSEMDASSGKIYCVVSRDDQRSSKENIYDSNHSNPSKQSSTRLEIYSSNSSQQAIYDRVDKSGCRSEENSIYDRTSRKSSSVDKLYEERFRNPEKIYTPVQEDVHSSRSNLTNNRNKLMNSQEDIYSNRSSKNMYHLSSSDCQDSSISVHRRRISREPEKSMSNRRVSRVVTMDKPLKKLTSDSSSNINIPEYSQPRVRKRSRAGSEPPVSRTEGVAKIVHESRLKRSQSDLDVDRGDLMTRVELPRRGSFLNSGTAKRPNTIKGGTPLGFTELFDEFRNQEGLTSVDDILAAIIDPEGMSFNDLKPLYKEFLLKLAATLTQDELYQRSASIMRRRRRPQRRRSTRRPCLLGRAIKRSVSRLKGGPTEFTSVIFPARRLNDSFGSSSSCDVKNNHNRNRVLASRLGRRKSSRRTGKNGTCHTTSEDSDTFRHLSKGAAAGANRSSSGYVSCSECSYDSESCTCVSADKCYCSLSRRVASEQQPVQESAMVCGCDTDSCSESNKCYCARRPIRPTILEQLRQRGIVPAESTLSRTDSPDRIRSSKISKNQVATRNIDANKVRSSPPCASSDNLALDYDLFSPGRKSQQSSSSEKVLVVSARDTQGRLVYVGGAERNKKCYSHGTQRSNGHHEALSIKKSAEIAAVFGGNSGKICRRASNASSIRSSISLEAGLGYLP